MANPKYKIRDNIILQLEGLKLTDDSLLDPEFIEDQMDIMRASLIREDFDNKKMSDEYYQIVDCLEVQCESASECTIDGITIESNEKFYYVNLPTLVTKIEWKNIKYLGTDKFGTRNNFVRKTLSGYIASAGNRYTGHNPLYTVVGEQAVLKNLPSLSPKFLTMVAILNDPLTACNYDAEDDYPVPSVNKLQLLVLKQVLSAYGLTRDHINDALREPMMTLGENVRTSKQ